MLWSYSLDRPDRGLVPYVAKVEPGRKFRIENGLNGFLKSRVNVYKKHFLLL